MCIRMPLTSRLMFIDNIGQQPKVKLVNKVGSNKEVFLMQTTETFR